MLDPGVAEVKSILEAWAEVLCLVCGDINGHGFFRLLQWSPCHNKYHRLVVGVHVNLIGLSQVLFSEPDAHGGVALFQDLELSPPQGDSASRLAAANGLGENRGFAAPFDSTR